MRLGHLEKLSRDAALDVEESDLRKRLVLAPDVGAQGPHEMPHPLGVGVEKSDQGSTFESQALRRLDRNGVGGSHGAFLEKCQLAEHVAWQQHREDDLRTSRTGAGDLDLSIQDQVQVLPKVALAEDMGARLERAAVKIGQQRLEVCRVHALEKGGSLEDLHRVHTRNLRAGRGK
jgi:hypothetical protein